MDNCPIAFARMMGADKVIAVDLVSAPVLSSLRFAKIYFRPCGYGQSRVSGF